MKKGNSFSRKILFNFLSVIIVFFFFSLTVNAHAQTTKKDTASIAEYDLASSIQEAQTYLLENKDGTTAEVEITPLTPLFRQPNGSYKVKYTQPRAWEGSFIVNIKNNKITSAHSPAVKPITGSITNYYLEKNSSTTISLHVYWKQGAVPVHQGMKAYISSKKLCVSKL